MSPQKKTKITVKYGMMSNSAFMIGEALEEAEDYDREKAALDPVAEYEIYTRFNEIVEDKTAIYISHRLSSCRFCDEILVFHEGRIVQKGSHEKLLAEAGGKYSELWNAQAQYYAEG